MELYISNKTWKEPKLTKGIHITVFLYIAITDKLKLAM